MDNIIITVYDEQFECSKAVKGNDYIHLYDANDICFASFEGIVSFDGYSISGGDWSEPEFTNDELIRADLDYCLMMLEG